MGQVETFADLLVGQAGRGERGDLVFLGGQRGDPVAVGPDGGQPAGPQFVTGPDGPGPGPERFEGAEGGAEVGAGAGGGPGPAQVLAVGQLNPGQVEGPPVSGGNGESLREELAGLVGRSGQRRGRTGQHREPGRDLGQAGLAHDGDVSDRFTLTAGANRRFHQVHRNPQGVGDVGGQDPGRADRDGLGVGLLEVAAAERGHRVRGGPRADRGKVRTLMADQPRQHAESLAQIEVRSIDQIPPGERHGRIRDQFTLWFGLNANIFPVVLGGVLVFMGLDFVWACIAIVLGVVIRLVLVGFHYVFIPWSAINLTDYYLVKHGEYDVASFFTPRGRYGGFLWPGLIAYVLAVAAQVPFIDQPFYTGPLVKTLGGTDISWIVGGLAGFVFYLIAIQRPGLTNETRVSPR